MQALKISDYMKYGGGNGGIGNYRPTALYSIFFEDKRGDSFYTLHGVPHRG